MSSFKRHLDKVLITPFIFHCSIILADDAYRIDLIIFQFLPEPNVKEKFETPLVEISDNSITISELNYPEIIKPKSINYDLPYKELFQDISISSILNNINQQEESIDPELIKMSAEQIFFQEDSGVIFPLEGISNSLQKSKNYRLISTKSWFQIIESKEESNSILIISENIRGVKVFGEITPYKNRFLHLDLNLYFLEKTENIDEALNLEIKSKKYNKNGLFDEELLNIFNANEEIFKTQYQIKESRKLRSKELHYIDHPKFGVIFQISPISKN
ncbi:peptidoglycan binding protein CsiV [SAR86 cluster bacterium]|nr:peptidoglycan binding protein CsiV [SAR86 cluster bacterium]